MEIAAIFHKPESEYAYLYEKNKMHVRIRTKKNDTIKYIRLHYGDSVIFHEDSYQYVNTMAKIASDAFHDYWQSDISADYGRIQYIFEIESTDGEKILYGDRGALPFETKHLNFFMNGFKLPYFHEVDRCKVPSWVANTIWYQIFPERFANGNPTISPPNSLPWDTNIAPENDSFFGGDLQGIIDKLDYLQNLGITGLYLCPIFEAPSNHKYDTLDYMEIDKHFGDKEVFRTLVNEAHKRDMKIMLDAVFNHIGNHSSQWKDVVVNGEQSRYKDWFHIQEFPVTSDNLGNNRKLNYHAFAFQGHMPKLNTANSEVKEYLLNIATYWIKEFDIDAWRLDVANEIDHSFWKEFQQRTLAIKPDLYILGEIWHTAQPWLNGDEFHGVMNYPLSESIKKCFLTKELSIDNLIYDVQSQLMYYKRQVTEAMFNLLDSHDTERILTTAKENCVATQSALTFMFLQLGTPCIYYGTEAGLTGGHDPDCRRVMPWNSGFENTKMFTSIQELIALRKAKQEYIQFGKISFRKENSLLVLRYSHIDKELIAYFNTSSQDVILNSDGKLLFSIASEQQFLNYTIKSDGCLILEK